MHQPKKTGREGFTLIELMMVIAIIGILAVLGMYGVNSHLAAAKAAEATNTIGAMNRSVVAAYERESAPSEVTIGAHSTAAAQALCKTSTPVPTAVPAARKYTSAASDYHIPGEPIDTGWTCLGFEVNGPQYYQYQYERAATSSIALLVTPPAGASWLSVAVGDLDGDGVLSNFVTGGQLDTARRAVTFTNIASANPEE
jgi:type IV pilus assembly protein PilA